MSQSECHEKYFTEKYKPFLQIRPPALFLEFSPRRLTLTHSPGPFGHPEMVEGSQDSFSMDAEVCATYHSHRRGSDLLP